MIDRFTLSVPLAGCALFAALVLTEIERPAPALPLAPQPVEHSEPPPALHRMPSAPAVEPVAEILARPLFSSTRRPPTATGDANTDTGLDDTRLTGIVIEPGHRLAIFAPNGAKALMVTEGGTVAGWRVDSITPQEVSLSGPDGTKTLQPKFDPNLVPPPEPAPTPPAPPPPEARPPRPGGVERPAVPLPRAARPPRPGIPGYNPGAARLRELRRR